MLLPFVVLSIMISIIIIIIVSIITVTNIADFVIVGISQELDSHGFPINQ